MKIVPSSYVVSVASSTNKCRGAQENVTPQMNSIIFDAKICGLTTLRGNTPQPWPTCSGGTNHANGRNISTNINRPRPNAAKNKSQRQLQLWEPKWSTLLATPRAPTTVLWRATARQTVLMAANPMLAVLLPALANNVVGLTVIVGASCAATNCPAKTDI